MSEEFALGVFHFDDTKPNFERLGEENGMRFWWASDLMGLMGYKDITKMKPVEKAISVCLALDIPFHENFVPQDRVVAGHKITDYKLSRFACYLAAMNSDSKKEQVASAQAYFATIAESFSRYANEAESIDRVVVRDEISQQEKSLFLACILGDVGTENLLYLISPMFPAWSFLAREHLKIRAWATGLDDVIVCVGFFRVAFFLG